MHTRKLLLAGVAALAILAAPAPARADISPGDLGDALSDLADTLIDAMWWWLLAPLDIPEIGVPVPLPEPVTDHVSGLPVTVDEAVDLATGRLANRVAQVTVLDDLAGMAGEVTATNAESLAALAALVVQDPWSVASGVALGSAAGIAGAGADATTAQAIAGLTSLEADRALLEAQAKVEAWNEIRARSPGGFFSGRLTFAPDVIAPAY